MLRWTKLIAPVASLALLVGFHQAQLRAEDTAKPQGKATVTVTVVDSAGKPVAGATVGIFQKAVRGKKHKGNGGGAGDGATTQPTDGAKPGKPQALVSGETAADGTVALAKVPDGEFSVRARLKGTGAGISPVTVVDDKDEAVSITLKARTPKN